MALYNKMFAFVTQKSISAAQAKVLIGSVGFLGAASVGKY